MILNKHNCYFPYLEPGVMFVREDLVLREGAEYYTMLCLNVTGEFAGRTVSLSFQTESTDGECLADCPIKVWSQNNLSPNSCVLRLE